MRVSAPKADDDHPPPAVASSFDELFTAEWARVVRTALLLVDDDASAEDVAQEAFAGLLRHWDRLDDPARARAYLHRAVVNGARSVLRRRRTARAWTAPHAVAGPSAEELALLGDQRREVLAAVAQLPERQREVVVLRYWSHLDEAATAEAMGISRGTVKSTAHRALASLQRRLQSDPSAPEGQR